MPDRILDTLQLELQLFAECSVCYVGVVIQTLALMAEQVLLTAEPGIFPRLHLPSPPSIPPRLLPHLYSPNSIYFLS